jgi:tRNA pseudouridine55 synthase
MSQANGLLLVHKSSGMTSHDVVARARRILKRKDIGHAGTLDPLASGLMVLLVGEATKLSDYILNGDKAYEAEVQFGITTDSMDITGQILSERPIAFSVVELESAVAKLTGEIELEVPKYSAIKVEGRKLYEYARKDQEVVIPKRIMRFYNLKFSELKDGRIHVVIHCSKGSYIRAWVNALGEILACGATLAGLKRIISTPYKLEKSLNLEEIEARIKLEDFSESLGEAWVPFNHCLPDFREVKLSGRDVQLIRNGQISNNIQTELLIGIKISESLPNVKLVNQETRDLLAILCAKPGEFYKIRRVFN